MLQHALTITNRIEDNTNTNTNYNVQKKGQMCTHFGLHTHR